MSKIDDVLNHMGENTYSFKVPLLSNKKETVEFRPLKTKDQKILVVEGSESSSELENFMLLIKLLGVCVTKNSLALGSILLEDFFWLLINLRMKSLGDTVELFGTCRHCGTSKNHFVINLEKDITITYLDEIKNREFKISDKLTFFLKHVCLDDMIDILKAKEDDESDGIEMSLASMIEYIEFDEEIMNIDDIESKLQLLNELSSKDLERFKTFLEDNTFGITIKKSFNCLNKECKKENLVELEGFDIIDFF